MVEYGTIEYYEKSIEELETEKEILLYALENVVKKDLINFNLLEKIAEKIADITNSLKWQKEELKKLYEARSEQNDN